MIESVSIRGFKSILSEDINLGTLNVLIGANGAGKSAILEAIGVLGAAADGRVDDASLLRRGVRPGVPKLYKSAFANVVVPRTIRLSARSIDTPSATYDVALDNPLEKPAAAWRFNNESVAYGDKPYVTRSPRGANFWGHAGKQRSFKPGDPTRSVAGTPSPFGPAAAPVNALLEILRNFTIYDPHTPVLRGTETDVLQRDPLGVHGGRLAEAIDELKTDGHFGDLTRDDLFTLLDWANEIRILPPTPDLISPSIPVATKIVRFRDRFMKAGRNVLSGYDASEGTLYVLFALVVLFHARAPRFFAIENIDHALHPRLARSVVGILAAYARANNRQIILTTHSPLVLDALELQSDDIRLLAVHRTEAGQTKVRRVAFSDALHHAKKRGFSLSQMWTQGLLGAVPNLG